MASTTNPKTQITMVFIFILLASNVLVKAKHLDFLRFYGDNVAEFDFPGIPVFSGTSKKYRREIRKAPEFGEANSLENLETEKLEGKSSEVLAMQMSRKLDSVKQGTAKLF